MKLQNFVKLKFGLVAALFLALVISLASFLGVTFANADRNVTINGSSVFFTASNAEVWAHREGEGDTAADYTMFVFTDDSDGVNFRKNLAFKWVENGAPLPEEPADSEGETQPAEIEFLRKDGWFNMEIGFADTNNEDGNLQFEKFILTFESQQYAQTKDNKSTNYIVFEKDADNKLNVYVTDKTADDEDLNAVLERLTPADKLAGTLENDHIAIRFSAYADGDYTVNIYNGDAEAEAIPAGALTGTFKNVGKSYASYSSSTTTPVTPLSFKAVFAEEDENEPEAHGNAFMTLYSLNNQSFELKNTSTSNGHISGGTVNDTTPPVLCLNKQVPFIQYNREISFDYTVIDVLASYPSLSTSRGQGVYAYMLTKDYATNQTAPKFIEDGGDFIAVTDSDDRYIFPQNKHYVPTAGYNAEIFDGENLTVKAAIKIVLKLTDVTSSGAQSTYVLLDWYVDDDYLVKVGEDDKEVSYIAVATDELGATFAYTENGQSDPDNNAEWQQAVNDYKAAVAEAAKDLKAGSKNYFYLPSVESLLSDGATAYSDLTFSIYYNNGTQQTASSKSASELSINLNRAGKYIFTVYATDAAGNRMYYFDGGEKVEFAASDIWNMYAQEEDTEFEGTKKYLPWFEFTVDYSEISIEDPDEQSTAYVDSSYTPDSFEINGVSVKTVYTLFEFRNDLWAEEHDGVALTYEEFVAQKDTLLDGGNRKYFTKIRATSELKEGDADYEKFHPYGWNGTSLSFTPQTANAFYLIRCEASSYETAEPVVKCMAIAAAPKVNPIKGEDTWAQDNMTSIILLCIAGACLIGIVLLLVIKPKNKGDVDEVLEAPGKPHKKNKRSV